LASLPLGRQRLSGLLDAIFALNVPFPMVALAAALIGYAGGR